MSQYVDGNEKGFEADGAIAQYARVKLDADGKVTVAGASDVDIGVAMREAFAAGDRIPVRLASAAGTFKVIAADEIATGAKIYTAASGKVNDVAGGVDWGRALEGASGDGSIIEALRLTPGETTS